MDLVTVTMDALLEDLKEQTRDKLSQRKSIYCNWSQEVLKQLDDTKSVNESLKIPCHQPHALCSRCFANCSVHSIYYQDSVKVEEHL